LGGGNAAGAGPGSAVGTGADVGAGTGETVGAGDGAGIEQAASITNSTSGRALSRRMDGTLQEHLPTHSAASQNCRRGWLGPKHHW